jgi:hypothetical protein
MTLVAAPGIADAAYLSGQKYYRLSIKKITDKQLF